MRHLRLVAKVITIIVLTPLVVIAALAIGQVYALLALLSLPFLLAFELIERKSEEAALIERELDLLQQIYPQVPRHMLRQAKWQSLMQQNGHEAPEPQLELRAEAETSADRSVQQRAPGS